jgi:acetyltransferase-like isoleucine patch superfamily enzyme
MNFIYNFISRFELQAYECFRSGKSIPVKFYMPLFLKGFFSLIESLIRNISGPFGFIIRRYYYKFVFNNCGKDVLIDVGVIFNGAQNISCGNKVWFDSYSIINSPYSPVVIGNNIHLHSHTYLGGREKIIIEDYCTISVGSKFFTGGINILTPKTNFLLNNPMMNVVEKSSHQAKRGPIIMKENSTILANCIVGPNVIIGRGSVLVSCSFLTKSMDEFSIYRGSPAKKIGKRR